MDKVKVSAVSYANSIPFVQGLINSDVIRNISLSLDTPAECAQKVKSGSADLGLVPVATIPEIGHARIISDFCLAANHHARTVLLVSEQPLNELNRIILDRDSKTSVTLARILACKFWMIKPQWAYSSDDFNPEDARGTTGAVVIGDKAFQVENKFKYQIDLAEEWRKYTGLPFVFACWVSNKELDLDFISDFNKALNKGLNEIEKSIKKHNGYQTDDRDLVTYLTQNISFILDDSKHEAMNLFYTYQEELIRLGLMQHE